MKTPSPKEVQNHERKRLKALRATLRANYGKDSFARFLYRECLKYYHIQGRKKVLHFIIGANDYGGAEFFRPTKDTKITAKTRAYRKNAAKIISLTNEYLDDCLSKGILGAFIAPAAPKDLSTKPKEADLTTIHNSLLRVKTIIEKNARPNINPPFTPTAQRLLAIIDEVLQSPETLYYKKPKIKANLDTLRAFMKESGFTQSKIREFLAIIKRPKNSKQHKKST